MYSFCAHIALTYRIPSCRHAPGTMETKAALCNRVKRNLSNQMSEPSLWRCQTSAGCLDMFCADGTWPKRSAVGKSGVSVAVVMEWASKGSASPELGISVLLLTKGHGNERSAGKGCICWTTAAPFIYMSSTTGCCHMFITHNEEGWTLAGGQENPQVQFGFCLRWSIQE